MQTAFVNFFEKRAEFPSFKKKSHRQSARFVQTSFELEGGKLSLARVPGPIRVRWSRSLPSRPSAVTVERDPAGRYFASFVARFEPVKLPVRDERVGIDLGITNLIVTSGGFKSGNHRHFRGLEAPPSGVRIGAFRESRKARRTGASNV